MRLLSVVVLFLAGALACSGGTADPPSAPEGESEDAAPEPPKNPPAARTDRDAPWVATGDVGPSSAILWARAPHSGTLAFAVSAAGGRPTDLARVQVDLATDYTTQVEATGLEPATAYTWTVTHDDGDQQRSAGGSFTTAPDEHVPVGAGKSALRFAVVGDLGGQGWCRDLESGYEIAQAVSRRAPQFVVLNGDMIYADGTCEAQGPEGRQNLPGDFPSIADPAVSWTDAAAVREVFDAHWRYNRADPILKSMLARTAVVAQWDDHEVINDFGGAWTRWETGDADRAGYENLVTQGRAAFFDWWPIRQAPGEPGRMYRKLSWGADLDLFVVDARSHRSVNAMVDGPDKTLLGADQAAWLTQGVRASKATFKVVSIDVPLSTPTGSNAARFGRDGVANGTGARDPGAGGDISASTGFEHEVGAILREWDTADVTGLVFVTTDVHFARTLRYSADHDDDGDKLVFHEVISGPLSAWKGEPGLVDPTFGPTVLYEEGGLDNFAAFTLERAHGGPVLTAEIVDAGGATRDGSTLELRAP